GGEDGGAVVALGRGDGFEDAGLVLIFLAGGDDGHGGDEDLAGGEAGEDADGELAVVAQGREEGLGGAPEATGGGGGAVVGGREPVGLLVQSAGADGVGCGDLSGLLREPLGRGGWVHVRVGLEPPEDDADGEDVGAGFFEEDGGAVEGGEEGGAEAG